MALTLAWTVAGCQPEASEATLDPELVSRFGLSGDEVVHTVALGGQGTVETVQPAELPVRTGEIVEFVAIDRRVHILRFLADSMGVDERAFLELTSQAASPPLVGQGSRFVVTFENAPPGRYPFVSRGYGEEAGGTIIVRSNN